MQARNFRFELRAILDGVDAIKLRLDRLRAGALSSSGVHAR